jgi:hypothetical protein
MSKPKKTQWVKQMEPLYETQSKLIERSIRTPLKMEEKFSFFDLQHVLNDMHRIETLEEEQHRLKQLTESIFVIIGILTALSSILITSYVAVGMSSLGLTFIGPLVTGLLGFLVVLTLERRH